MKIFDGARGSLSEASNFYDQTGAVAESIRLQTEPYMYTLVQGQNSPYAVFIRDVFVDRETNELYPTLLAPGTVLSYDASLLDYYWVSIISRRGQNSLEDYPQHRNEFQETNFAFEKITRQRGGRTLIRPFNNSSEDGFRVAVDLTESSWVDRKKTEMIINLADNSCPLFGYQERIAISFSVGSLQLEIDQKDLELEQIRLNRTKLTSRIKMMRDFCLRSLIPLKAEDVIERLTGKEKEVLLLERSVGG